MWLASFPNVVDLTHCLDETIPTWNGSCGFRHEVKRDYPQGVRVLKYAMHAGIGTHIDAPSHFFEGAPHVAQISLRHLIVPACVIDISDAVDPDRELTYQDVERFEAQHGPIEEGCLVMAYTGWEKHWGDPVSYRNADAQGKMHFPGFSTRAAERLLQRGVVGIGIDTLSPDGSHEQFPVHECVLGAHRYILENVANLQQLPPRGALVVVLPIKVREGTEAPIRAVALF